MVETFSALGLPTVSLVQLLRATESWEKDRSELRRILYKQAHKACALLLNRAKASLTEKMNKMEVRQYCRTRSFTQTSATTELAKKPAANRHYLHHLLYFGCGEQILTFMPYYELIASEYFKSQSK